MEACAPDMDSTEQFLMYGYKVVPCSKRYRHDWSVCPFAHTGEMAARRDPSRYLPIFCFHSKQRLPCPRGEECPYSHNLFEYWLHPQRYRTEMCQFGASCTRPVCFFAHGEHQLRHTGMPGGPQPIVAPPEPNLTLGDSNGFGAAVVSGDPAAKQQQQLLALHAAAAGFASAHGGSGLTSTPPAPVGIMHSEPLMPLLEGAGVLMHPHGGSSGISTHSGGGCGAGGSSVYGSILDGGEVMDMGALHRELSGISVPGGYAAGGGAAAGGTPSLAPASSPLSAPLPQLSPDVLAALQAMPPGAAGLQATGPLLHASSGMPPHGALVPPPAPPGASAAPPPGGGGLHGLGNHLSSTGGPQLRPLSRSFTVGASVAHAALASAGMMAPGAPLSSVSGGLMQQQQQQPSPRLDELARQLQLMQLMQSSGTVNASAPLPSLGSTCPPGMMGELLDTLAQLQVTQPGGSGDGGVAVAACTQSDPRCPSPLASTMPLPCPGLRLGGGLLLPSDPASPLGGGGAAAAAAGRPLGSLAPQRTPSPPVAATAESNSDTRDAALKGGRDAGGDAAGQQVTLLSSQGVGGKKPLQQLQQLQPGSGSVPTSPSCNGHADVCGSVDVAAPATLRDSSSRAVSNGDSSRGSNSSSPSTASASACGLLGRLPSDISTCDAAAAAPLLVIGDCPVQSGAVLAEALRCSTRGDGDVAPAPTGCSATSAMGEAAAVKLLATLPEDSVRRLLNLMAAQGGADDAQP